MIDDILSWHNIRTWESRKRNNEMLSVNKTERFVCRPFVVCQIEWQTLDKKLYLTKTFDISILRYTHRNCFFPLTCPTVNKGKITVTEDLARMTKYLH